MKFQNFPMLARALSTSYLYGIGSKCTVHRLQRGGADVELQQCNDMTVFAVFLWSDPGRLPSYERWRDLNGIVRSRWFNDVTVFSVGIWYRICGCQSI